MRITNSVIEPAPFFIHWEACLAIQNIRDDVPIVLSSGYEETDLSKRFNGYRMAAFIQKPFQLATLQGILQSVLE